MSDTEEDATFDREAEKEKLREQLRREEENRRSTQHMSELLLKGATMTNKHCDVCGDPLFRYEGQEFCPTCSQTGGAEGAAGGEQAGTVRAAADAAATGEAAPASGTGIDRVETGGGERPAPGSTAATEGGAPQPGGVAGEGAAAPGTAVPDAGGEVPGDVAAARASLVRKLNALARQAEATEDVGRSRELLSAAREAAEALAAIDAIRG